MASLATTLGLRAPSLPNLTTPNYAPAYITLHFILAYCVLAPRHLKQIHGIDHNVSPREDLAKYGDAAVRSGKLTAAQLAMMRRNESAHANAIENYTLFVAAMAFATLAGVERELVNRAGLVYTVARVAYGAVYVFADRLGWSVGRSAAWWVGNGSCLWLLYRAGARLNGSLMLGIVGG
ncbi:hypothetical protein MMC27_003475 [Xylographa pallens]|nr:hypothetical protein [Xylographa pallens]